MSGTGYPDRTRLVSREKWLGRHNKLARPAVLFYRTAMAEKEPSESALLAAYRAGDRTALETLVRRFERPLFAFLLRMTSAADAEDLYQETWVRALRSLDAFDDRKPLSWLFRIARNLTLDRARRTQSRRAWETETRHTANEGGGPSPAEEAAGRDLASHIRRTVSRLPPAQREVFLMRVEGELPFREIARVQGVSINTALARMQYALEKLRAEWRNEWEGGRS